MSLTFSRGYILRHVVRHAFSGSHYKLRFVACGHFNTSIREGDYGGVGLVSTLILGIPFPAIARPTQPGADCPVELAVGDLALRICIETHGIEVERFTIQTSPVGLAVSRVSPGFVDKCYSRFRRLERCGANGRCTVG